MLANRENNLTTGRIAKLDSQGLNEFIRDQTIDNLGWAFLYKKLALS